MDIRDIKYFLAIAEEGSITAAAKRLHIAQPPLSRHMRELEQQLGVQLFERGKRRVRLTEAGVFLRTRAEQIIDLLSATTTELRDFYIGDRGTLSIGAVTSVAGTLLPQLIKQFRERYPHVVFRLREGESRRITELLDSGIIDLGMVKLPFDTELYDSISLPDEPLVAVFRPDHPHAIHSASGSVNLQELADKPLLIHRKFEPLLTKSFEQIGCPPTILCESDDVMPMLAWADAGIGLAIVPRSAFSLIHSTRLIAQEIVNPALITGSAVIWVRNRYLPATAHHFLGLFGSKTGESKRLAKDG
ncbi:MAG: LysR family transcriptional regulator [Sporomusaceae bacterium]|nr:LysR family transcriptional regulator [Sporomusaceae bacterium]